VQFRKIQFGILQSSFLLLSLGDFKDTYKVRMRWPSEDEKVHRTGHHFMDMCGLKRA
jgi:hypothetical protein